MTHFKSTFDYSNNITTIIISTELLPLRPQNWSRNRSCCSEDITGYLLSCGHWGKRASRECWIKCSG